MAKRTAVHARAEIGLAPPQEPIPGAITYEQVPIYAANGAWWWWNSPTRIAVVGACVRLIGHQISTLPAAVFRDHVKVPDQPGWVRNPAPSAYDWLGDAVEAIVVSLLLRGNAYVMSTGTGSNDYPLGWVVANPDTVTIERRAGRKVYKWGSEITMAEDEVTHIRWLVAPESDYGLAPLSSAINEVISAAALTKYGADMAVNGAMPFGVLTTDQRLKLNQASQLGEQWATTGANRRGVLVLDSGLSYEQLQLSPRDMALLEILEWDDRAICSVFGVPPWLVNVPMADGLTYSTVQGQTLALLSFTLDPILTKIEGALSYKFLPGDRVLKFDREKFVRPPTTERMTAHATAISAGIYSADEAREMEGMPPRTEPLPPPPVPVEETSPGGSDARTQ